MARSCPFCSEEIHANAVKCIHCGEPLPAPKGGARRRGSDEDLSAVLGWVFEDPNWVAKVGIGTVCMLFSGLLVPFFILEGYKFRIARQQRKTPGATPMPEFDDLGGPIADGAKMFCNMLLFTLGLLLCGAALVGGGVAIDLATSGRPGPFAFMAAVGMYALLILGSFALAFFLPAIELEYLETGSPASILHLRSLWRRIVTRPGDYFLVFAYHFLANLIGQFLAFLLCAPPAWGFFTQGCIIGRYAAQQQAKDAPPPREGGDEPAPQDWS